MAGDTTGAAAGRMNDCFAFDETVSRRGTVERGLDPWPVEQFTSLDRFIAADEAAAISPDLKSIVTRNPFWLASFVAQNVPAWR